MRQNNKRPQLAQDRIEVLNKIKEYERTAKFDVDVENDPPAPVLMPNQIDYLQKKLSTKFKRRIAYIMAGMFLNSSLKNKNIVIKQINGIEKVAVNEKTE